MLDAVWRLIAVRRSIQFATSSDLHATAPRPFAAKLIGVGKSGSNCGVSGLIRAQILDLPKPVIAHIFSMRNISTRDMTNLTHKSKCPRFLVTRTLPTKTHVHQCSVYPNDHNCYKANSKIRTLAAICERMKLLPRQIQAECVPAVTISCVLLRWPQRLVI